MSNSTSTLRNKDDLLDAFAGLPTDADGRLLPWVKGRRCDYGGSTSGVPQIAQRTLFTITDIHQS